MGQSNTVKTRILIISDTHNALPLNTHTDAHDNSHLVPFKWPLPKADVLLHAGDLTSNGKDLQHERALELLTRIDASLKVVIPGNHDITLDRDYYADNPHLHASYAKYSPQKLDEIEHLYTGKHAKAAGIEYMVEGTRTFDLPNGARFTLYASAYQPEFYSWAFGYPRHVDRFNPESGDAVNPVTGTTTDATSVDIMLTHGPPLGILDRTFRGDDVGCEHLRRAVERAKPRMNCFGHIHEAWGALTKDWSGAGDHDEHYHQPDAAECVGQMGAYIDATALRAGQETLFINASIMDRSYKPRQSPWIVDMMLPKGTLVST
ncbi:hypothetical protein DV736_g1947, partial [Chaetothyriales sp. CBS 134916]